MDVITRYEELLNAVKTKHEDESRHQTALRYIEEAEQDENGAETYEVKDPKENLTGMKFQNETNEYND